MTRIVFRATRVVSDPALARVIGFYNIYQNVGIDWIRNIVMHCENTTLVYPSDFFSKYMNVEGGASKDIFNYLFNIGVRKILLEKGKEISIWSIW